MTAHTFTPEQAAAIARSNYHRDAHDLPRANRRRFRARTIHRCPCGDMFVVERLDLDTQGNVGYRWKWIDFGGERC